MSHAGDTERTATATIRYVVHKRNGCLARRSCASGVNQSTDGRANCGAFIKHHHVSHSLMIEERATSTCAWPVSQHYCAGQSPPSYFFPRLRHDSVQPLSSSTVCPVYAATMRYVRSRCAVSRFALHKRGFSLRVLPSQRLLALRTAYSLTVFAAHTVATLAASCRGRSTSRISSDSSRRPPSAARNHTSIGMWACVGRVQCSPCACTLHGSCPLCAARGFARLPAVCSLTAVCVYVCACGSQRAAAGLSDAATGVADPAACVAPEPRPKLRRPPAVHRPVEPGVLQPWQHRCVAACFPAAFC